MAASHHSAAADRPSVAVDLVLFSQFDGALHVLLVRRGREPFQGAWAFPGGFVEIDESLEDAAQRELYEETGLSDVAMQQLHTFGDPGRDPRMRVISVAYTGHLAPDQASAIRAGDDAAEVRWRSVEDLPALAFDHEQILRFALARAP
jgi:8-oxo-dGTP diphosphatase